MAILSPFLTILTPKLLKMVKMTKIGSKRGYFWPPLKIVLKSDPKKYRHGENPFFGCFLGVLFTTRICSGIWDPQKRPKNGFQGILAVFPMPGPQKMGIFPFLDPFSSQFTTRICSGIGDPLFWTPPFSDKNPKKGSFLTPFWGSFLGGQNTPKMGQNWPILTLFRGF